MRTLLLFPLSQNCEVNDQEYTNFIRRAQNEKLISLLCFWRSEEKGQGKSAAGDESLSGRFLTLASMNSRLRSSVVSFSLSVASLYLVDMSAGREERVIVEMRGNVVATFKGEGSVKRMGNRRQPIRPATRPICCTTGSTEENVRMGDGSQSTDANSAELN